MTSEQQATTADAEQRLTELVTQRARVANQARTDPELRSEVEAIDREILSCKRQLGQYCLDCGNRLLRVNGADVCCWGPCQRHGQPNLPR